MQLFRKNKDSWEWIVLVVYMGCSIFVSAKYKPAAFCYHLANYTGTAEVVNGNTSGYNGLGDVSSFDKHPMLDYNSIYFDGSDSSFVELRVGTTANIDNDWSFTMFVYSVAPHTGTIFEFIYDGGGQSNGDKWSNTIRLELNESQMLLTMLSPNGQEYGSAVIDKPTIFTSDRWIPLSVVHHKNNGNIDIKTENKMYTFKQNNEDKVKLPLPARIKLGGAYNRSNPFEGSITCFAIYKSNFSQNAFDRTLQDECNSSRWETKPTEVGITLGRLQKAYACSTATTGVDRCNFFDITCREDRIRIRKAMYGFREAQPENCSSGNDQCRTEGEGCCTKSDKDTMMPFNEGHYHDIHNACSWQKGCFKQTPIGAGLNNIQSKYSVIYYECQAADHIAHFCGNESVTGKSVSIIFNESKTEKDYFIECVCRLHTIHSNEGYRISAPDLRLQSVSEDCSSNASIAGLKETNITCSTSQTKMGFLDRDSDSNIQLSFTSTPQFIWILAQAKGKSEISVTCFPPTDMENASSTTSLPDATKQASPESTAASNTTNTTSTVIANITLSARTSPSTSAPYKLTSSTSHIVSESSKNGAISRKSATTTLTTITTTITTDFNQSEELAVSELNSETFPIAAVAIPVILLLLGAVVGLVLWQRWKRRKSETKKSDKDHTQESQNHPSSSIQNKAYDNTDQLNGPVKTADNYIVLDQENAYTYIDHEDAKAAFGSSNDSKQLALKAAHLQGTNYPASMSQKEGSLNKDDIKSDTTIPAENDYTGTHGTANANHSYSILEPQVSTKAVDKNSLAKLKRETDNVANHNYFVLEPPNTHAVEEKNNRKPAEQSKDDSLESRNYFVLEPQDSIGANPKSPQIKETSQVDTDTAEKETTQNHNYFVLEPQSPQAAHSETSKRKATTSDITQTEEGKHHNYFVLEPQDTYSSIDPDDVLVQTLPENDYNVINMKGKPVSKDPNYGTLITAGQIGQDVEESGEYSHIQNNSDNKLDVNEYSHTTFKTMKPHTASATDDCYSQLSPTKTKLSDVTNNGNEYSL